MRTSRQDSLQSELPRWPVRWKNPKASLRDMWRSMLQTVRGHPHCSTSRLEIRAPKLWPGRESEKSSITDQPLGLEGLEHNTTRCGEFWLSNKITSKTWRKHNMSKIQQKTAQVFRRLGSNLTLFLLAAIYLPLAAGEMTEVAVELSAPRWVARGGTATLRCLHQVPPQLIYKVEFLRTGGKLLQYVRERNPPYTNYTVPGARLNMSLSSASEVILQNVEFSASALYWCEVSLDTPIYTAASPAHLLTVVHPQKHPPIITFGSPDVVVGGVLRANCTSAPASPPPHLTWYIDGNKVEDTSVRFYSYRVSSSYRSGGRWRKHHHRKLTPDTDASHAVRHRPGADPARNGARSRPAPDGGLAVRHRNVGTEAASRPTGADTTVDPTTPATNASKFVKCSLKDGPNEELRSPPFRAPPPPPPAPLTVSVSELRAPAHGRLQLTCVATIPESVAPGDQYADIKKQTVAVAVNELHPKKPAPDAAHAAQASPRRPPYRLLVAALAASLAAHALPSLLLRAL